MKSRWYILALFRAASAVKYFSNLVDAVGDHESESSLICMSPLRHILAFSLSRPPYGINLVLNASLTGIISSACNGLSFRSNVSLSNKPMTSPDIAYPHLSLILGDNRNI